MSDAQDHTSPIVRAVSTQDIFPVVALHHQVLNDEFIARFGQRFLREYYRGFMESPYAVALVARDGEAGPVLGGLLGTLDPVAHYALFTRRHGFRMAVALLGQVLLHPSLGFVLLRTRLRRYVLGVIRQFRRRPAVRVATPATTAEPPLGAKKVADMTHLFVDPIARSRKLGSALVAVYEEEARRYGVERIDLVTLPVDQGGAGPFYEKLGWQLQGRRTSRSGEEFLLYEKNLPIE